MDAKNDPASLSNSTAVALDNDPAEIATGFVSADTVNYHGFWLSVPASQFGEAYSSTVTVTYANV
jgi:hypothetical protein